MQQPVNEGYRWLKLSGLDPEREYRVKNTAYKMAAENYTYYGDELMEKGSEIKMSKKARKKIKRIFLSKHESCIISITVRGLPGEIQKGSDLCHLFYTTPVYNFYK